MRSPHFARLALIALLAACQSTQDKVEEQKLEMHREFAKAYFDQGQYQQAEAQVDLALELDSDDATLKLMKAWIVLRRGTPDAVLEAEQRFRALRSSSDYRVQLGLAEALERKGVMYSESAEAVARGERPTAALDRGARAVEMRVIASDSWNEAVALYEQTLKAKSGEIQALNGLQRTHALRGDWEASLSWADKLLEQSTGEIAFWKTQLERAGISADEEANLRNLLGASTKLLVETHLQASTLLHQLGRGEEALAHLDHVAALDPDNVQIYGRRAVLLHKLGRFEQARMDVQQFLRLSTASIEHPDMQRALDLLAQCDAELAKTAQQTH